MPSRPHAICDQNGDIVPFDDLYDRHFEAIFRYVLHRVGHVATAEDLTAQTFFKALRNLWRYRWSRGTFSTWLYRIATNEVNTFFRRRQKDPAWNEHSRTVRAHPGVQEELSEAERYLVRETLFIHLQQAISRLDLEEQTLLTLRYFEEKSFPEIAAIMRKRRGTVVMRVHRALKKLRETLQEQGIEPETMRGCYEKIVQTPY
jgi:RNA polymerase sigma-70 factor (ECF subfamily)